MISLEKWMILAPLQKLHKNVGDLGQLIVAKGFKKLPKVQKSPTLVTLPWYAEITHSDWQFQVPWLFWFHESAMTSPPGSSPSYGKVYISKTKIRGIEQTKDQSLKEYDKT